MKIVFTGDVSFTGNFREKINQDEFVFSENILSYFKEHDHAVLNLEGPATEQSVIYDKHINVVNPLKSIVFLKKKLGNVIFNLANNHTFDAGCNGFVECKEEIISNNLDFLGAGLNIQEASKIMYLKKDGLTVALIAVGAAGASSAIAGEDNYGVFGCQDSLIAKKISEAKQKSDWVVLSYHNGAEFNFYPTKIKQKKLRSFIDIGVDIVIAHHPHVVQGLESYNNGVIFYSLGNFVFDLPYHRLKKKSNLSLIPSISFKKETYSVKYKISQNSYEKGRVEIVRDKKELKHFQELCDNLDSIDKYRRRDAVRCVFFNPFFSPHWWINLFFPLLIPYKMYIYGKGNDRFLLYDALAFFKCLGLYKRLTK